MSRIFSPVKQIFDFVIESYGNHKLTFINNKVKELSFKPFKYDEITVTPLKNDCYKVEAIADEEMVRLVNDLSSEEDVILFISSIDLT